MNGVELAQRLEHLDIDENIQRSRYEEQREQCARNLNIHADMGRFDRELRQLDEQFREDLGFIQHQRDRLQRAGRGENYEIRRNGQVARRPGYRPMSPFFDEESRTEHVVRSELTIDQLANLPSLRGMTTLEPGAMIAVDDPHIAVAYADAARQRDMAEAMERAIRYGHGNWKITVDEDAEYKENDVKTTEKQATFAYCSDGHKRYIEPQERAFYLARCTEQGCNKFLKAGTALEATKQDGPAKSKKQAVNP